MTASLVTTTSVPSLDTAAVSFSRMTVGSPPFGWIRVRPARHDTVTPPLSATVTWNRPCGVLTLTSPTRISWFHGLPARPAANQSWPSCRWVTRLGAPPGALTCSRVHVDHGATRVMAPSGSLSVIGSFGSRIDARSFEPSPGVTVRHLIQDFGSERNHPRWIDRTSDLALLTQVDACPDLGDEPGSAGGLTVALVTNSSSPGAGQINYSPSAG